MDGHRIQEYMANEAISLLTLYRQFQTLLPHPTQNASVHHGEDGRYVESLIKEYLKRYLPQELEVATGFILRPGVKTGLNNRSRFNETDQNSSQLDIIIYDSHHYPVFQRFGDNVIVPPEGVIGIISVKKKFNDTDFRQETIALKNAAKLCRCASLTGHKIRGPFLALVGMDSIVKKTLPTHQWIFNQFSSAFNLSDDTFDEAIGLITNLEGWSIFKRRPRRNTCHAEYLYYEHRVGEEHLGLQHLLTGILSVYYDPSRNNYERPGFTAFSSDRIPDYKFKKIEFTTLR